MAHTYHVLHARPGLYYPTRRQKIDLIVIHSAEGTSARGVARYFTSAGAGGSAHMTVDDTEVWRSVYDHETAFGAKGHNGNGLHLELCGYAKWSRSEWLRHKPMLREGAKIVADWMEKYDVPFRKATLAADGRMRNGHHSHNDLPGNDHWDPGPSFPWDVFLGYVRENLDKTPPDGATLRLYLTPKGKPRRVWAGWDEAGPALKWIVQNGIRSDTVAAIAWQGNIWRGSKAVENVAANLVRRFL